MTQLKTAPRQHEINWKKPAMPRVAIQAIPVDPMERMLVMHRSEKVRSARNVWSFPSGLHEVGETWEQCIKRELMEEYGLETRRLTPLGVYENIAGDVEASEQYHWFVMVVGATCTDVTFAQNKEPDKHDRMEFVPLASLAPEKFESFLSEHPFHESFMTFVRDNVHGLYNKLRIATIQ